MNKGEKFSPALQEMLTDIARSLSGSDDAARHMFHETDIMLTRMRKLEARLRDGR